MCAVLALSQVLRKGVCYDWHDFHEHMAWFSMGRTFKEGRPESDPTLQREKLESRHSHWKVLIHLCRLSRAVVGCSRSAPTL